MAAVSAMLSPLSVRLARSFAATMAATEDIIVLGMLGRLAPPPSALLPRVRKLVPLLVRSYVREPTGLEVVLADAGLLPRGLAGARLPGLRGASSKPPADARGVKPGAT